MIPKAPRGFDKEAKGVWEKVLNEYVLDDSMLPILEEALRAHMRLRQAREQIDREGLTIITGTGMIRKHPACEIEKEARSGFLMAWRMLNLDVVPPGPVGRPGGSRRY